MAPEVMHSTGELDSHNMSPVGGPPGSGSRNMSPDSTPNHHHQQQQQQQEQSPQLLPSHIFGMMEQSGVDNHNLDPNFDPNSSPRPSPGASPGPRACGSIKMYNGNGNGNDGNDGGNGDDDDDSIDRGVVGVGVGRGSLGSGKDIGRVTMASDCGNGGAGGRDNGDNRGGDDGNGRGNCEEVNGAATEYLTAIAGEGGSYGRGGSGGGGGGEAWFGGSAEPNKRSSSGTQSTVTTAPPPRLVQPAHLALRLMTVSDTASSWGWELTRRTSAAAAAVPSAAPPPPRTTAWGPSRCCPSTSRRRCTFPGLSSSRPGVCRAASASCLRLPPTTRSRAVSVASPGCLISSCGHLRSKTGSAADGGRPRLCASAATRSRAASTCRRRSPAAPAAPSLATAAAEGWGGESPRAPSEGAAWSDSAATVGRDGVAAAAAATHVQAGIRHAGGGW